MANFSNVRTACFITIIIINFFFNDTSDIPIMVANAKRNFSKLKIIKNFFPSTISVIGANNFYKGARHPWLRACLIYNWKPSRSISIRKEQPRGCLFIPL